MAETGPSSVCLLFASITREVDIPEANPSCVVRFSQFGFLLKAELGERSLKELKRRRLRSIDVAVLSDRKRRLFR